MGGFRERPASHRRDDRPEQGQRRASDAHGVVTGWPKGLAAAWRIKKMQGTIGFRELKVALARS